MMNNHMPAGPGQQHMHQPPPMYQQSRRQQEYHAHTFHHPPPQSQMHHQYGYPQQYYPHPGPPPHHYQPRWQPSPYQHQYMPPPPPQQVPYQPRSPVVVTSQPYSQNMTPVPRHTPMQHPPPQQAPPVAQSPRPIPHHMPPQMHTPVVPPSPAPTSKQEQEQAAPPAVQEQTPPPQPPSRRQSAAYNPLASPPEHKMPYYPPLPWYSHKGGKASFPPRAAGKRRRRQNMRDVQGVALPAKEDAIEEGAIEEGETKTVRPSSEDDETVRAPPSEISTAAAPSEQATPSTSQAPSESDATAVSTPATPAQAKAPSPKTTPTQPAHNRRDTRTAIAVPNIPGIAKPKASPTTTDKEQVPATPAEVQASVKAAPAFGDAPTVDTEGTQTTEEAVETPEIPLPKPAPKSWADLVKRNAPSKASTATPNGAVMTNGAALPRSASLADALKQYSVENDRKLAFLEPRGLVNIGNMCYMNSILQVLVFCTPFYSFLEQVRQRTVHSIKSDTPLVDAMIMFMREFQVLASAESVEGLRASLGQQQLEQYGEAFTPEYVYDAIRKLDRFSSMRRGHQQDAEEFFGFLLEGLHDECVKVMQSSADEPQENGVTSPSAVMSPTSADGWLEVGPRQKASTTRTAGSQDAPTPVTKIFGGHLRSELRVAGLKDSVTLEPYKPLQLDIGAQHVNNIIDALKGLTRTETLTGDFGGRSNSAKKQVFIDTLPPVLILHLKRFQYENNLTGTQKIWKKVGYPLELEIPKEVFPPSKRGGLAVKGGLPKYRLTSVVYHHGKSAAGGHYTVDVLREDGREWVRLDDTVIRRIRPEDVAEGGAEEDPKLLAKALEQHKADQEMQKQRNMYQGLDEADREPEVEKPWSEVNGHVPGHRKWSSVANTNGTATPVSGTGKATPRPAARKEGVRDNKVAYILLYERMRA